MGVMDKFLNIMKLNDDEEYYDEDYYDEEEELEEPVKERGFKKASKLRDDMDDYEERAPKKQMSQPKITPMRQPVARKVPGNSNMEVCVIKPSSVEEAREVTETLLANRTVVLNLEGLDVDVAQRIIDFTSGSCFAISGNLQKISHYIFIITPASVDISGDFQNILGGTNYDGPIDSGM